MATPTQTRRILIKADVGDSAGLKQMAQQMGLLNKNTKSMSESLGFLTSTFKGYLASLGVREIARMSDEMQNLSNRLKIISKEGEDSTATMQKIVDLANETNQPIAGIAESYVRLGSSMRQAKPSAEQLLTLTKALTNSFRVAGTTTTETTNTMVQLSQAFASGELRGQELRSVMEQNAELAGILRERFGPGIMKLGDKDVIKTADFMKVLRDNMERINTEAEKLTPTFEQTLAKGINKFQLGIHTLNTELGISSKFATAFGFAVDHIGQALIIAAVPASAWALTYLPQMIVGMRALTVASWAFAKSNVLLLVFTALAAIGVTIYENWDKVKRMFEGLRADFLDLSANAEEFGLKIRSAFASMTGLDMSKQLDNSRKSIDEMRKSAEDIRKTLKVQDAAGNNDPAVKDPKAVMDELIKQLQGMGAKAGVEKLKDILGELNRELASGAITLTEYYRKIIEFDMMKLNRQFKEGKFDVFEYNERLKKLNMDELNRQLKDGTINMKQFMNAALEVGKVDIDAKFAAGKINLQQYNEEINKLKKDVYALDPVASGIYSYIESIGTLADNIAGGIQSAFGHLEDNLIEFIKKGKFNFSQFTQAILDDITKIIIRASIVRPLAEGILGGFTGGSSPAPSYGGGSVSQMPINKFASGGIVDSPTFFGYGGNKMGVAGEAGAEAILPLQRGSNGSLGVAASVTPVNINIINQSGANIEQTETTGPSGEKSIEILIHGKVKEGLATGKYDKEMRSSYNVNRKGS